MNFTQKEKINNILLDFFKEATEKSDIFLDVGLLENKGNQVLIKEEFIDELLESYVIKIQEVVSNGKI